jgi:hypothetical protein
MASIGARSSHGSTFRDGFKSGLSRQGSSFVQHALGARTLDDRGLESRLDDLSLHAK